MQLDLTSLSAAELRSLLDSARDRGQAAQSYQILQEMARRRESGPKPRGRRRPAEPRIIDLDLGDPLDRKVEDELLAMPDPPPAEPDPDADPLAGLTLAVHPPAAPKKRRPERRGPPGLVVFAAGASVGVAAGVALAIWTGVGASRALTPAAAPVQVAAVQPPAALAPAVAEIAAPPVLPVETVAPDAEAPDQLQLVLTSPDAAEAGEDAATRAPEPPQPPAAEPDACAAAPTPADRAICADPALQRLQQELRQAYAEALDAHADRGLLRQRQLAWRDARNGVDDPDRLAGLYEQRIRKLAAATADAKRQRP
ncbi:hypothetical protein [Phenylobacterium sp.]|uniref:hypothetical protein n=1 Tax=Phenylobacterium sp. TaxID=1871053 RepID=UPI002B51BD6E|nr:hypothetical protein [Phenylobacterium sp.]HVI32263.1 hypothetical protein [Phenylobacterium sp.]